MATPAPATTEFVMQRQQQPNWCWAAVAASIDSFLNAPAKTAQAAVATKVLKDQVPAGCEINGQLNAACNLGNSLTAALDALHRLARQPIPRPLKFAEIREAIDARFPIPVRIVWDDDPDTAHAVVISGYIPSAIPQVQVDDPFYGRSVVDLETLVSGYHSVGTWDRAYPVLGGKR
jgi:hypothetical protein